MEYTKEYFINKFEAIPDKEIGTLLLDHHCALWHCGVRNVNGAYEMTEESKALAILFGGTDEPSNVYEVNDGHFKDGKTPKQRILNKLKKLR